ATCSRDPLPGRTLFLNLLKYLPGTQRSSHSLRQHRPGRRAVRSSIRALHVTQRHIRMTSYLAELDPVRLNLVEIFGLLIGGLALFLLGLEFMTGGLKAIAGARLQSLLGVLTANRFRGMAAGAAVTALLNSSTITTVLMVGFVSAGLMTLGQAVPMIMGANIGSTITAQIVAFDVSRLTPFML